MSSSQAFSSLSCEEVFVFAENARVVRVNPLRKNHRHSTTGMESYKQLLTRLAQSSLGVDNLSPQQVKALKTYHDVVRGEDGKDGTFARVGNYTFPQRRRIVRFLRQFFSPEQVTTLIEDGVVEISRSSDLRITRRVLRHFNEGKKVFIQLLGNSKVLRVGKILKEINSGWLVEAESVDNKSGRIVKEQVFLVRGRIDVPYLLEVEPVNMTKISEKTDSGFVINILTEKYGPGGNKVFFSFEKAIENGLLPRNPTDQDYHKLEDILNSYISNNFDQLVQALKAVGVSVASSPFRYLEPLLQKSLIKGESNFVLANPELEFVFLAAESTRERINSSELNLPPLTNEEAKLAEQGYRSVYIGGLNQVNERAIVRRRLQELQANPRITHIEYFANQISVHIAHIRQGLKENYSQEGLFSGSKLEQLQQLDSLEKEAKEAISNGRVTYRWWIKFNTDLSILISGGTINRNLNPNLTDSESRDLNLFPMKVIMPVIQESEDLGIMTFNRISPEGVYPAGLINKQRVKVHDGAIDADFFFTHDGEHANFPGNTLYLEYSAGHRLFHKQLLKNIERITS